MSLLEESATAPRTLRVRPISNEARRFRRRKYALVMLFAHKCSVFCRHIYFFPRQIRRERLRSLGGKREEASASICHTIIPRLITSDISGFRDDDALSHLKAYGLIVRAQVGLCSITATADGRARVGVSSWDISGGMTALHRILQALLHRECSGQGAAIHLSLVDALADWMNLPVLQNDYRDYSTERAGVNHASLAIWRVPASRRRARRRLGLE
ncbi:CoA transferase [Bradyrhizobium sp. USDA 4486]